MKYHAAVSGEIRLTGARSKAITGYPDPRHISTSCAVRNNFNCRTFLQRLARWIYFAHYNFVRIYGSRRVTPALAAKRDR